MFTTYNFEVEEHHTYIASGVRVHNISEAWAHNFTGIDDFASLGLAIAFDVPGYGNVVFDSGSLNDHYGDITSNTTFNGTALGVGLSGALASFDTYGNTGLSSAVFGVGLYDVGGQNISASYASWAGHSVSGYLGTVQQGSATVSGYFDSLDPSDYGYQTGSAAHYAESSWEGGGGFLSAYSAATGHSIYSDATYDAYHDMLDRRDKAAKDSDGGSGKPIIIDLDNDGIEILPQTDNYVLFDFDDDGYLERTAWVGADDAFLMFDEGEDSEVSTAREIAFAQWIDEDIDLSPLFDQTTAAAYDTNEDGQLSLAEVLQALHQTTDKYVLDTDGDGTFSDLEALAGLFDTNQDGVLNSQDQTWAQMRVWQDGNSDGVVQDGELKSLDDSTIGINEISLTFNGDDSVILYDGTMVNGFIDIERTNELGETETILGADVALSYAANGVKIDKDDSGNINYIFEFGGTNKHVQLQADETHYVLNPIDDDEIKYTVSSVAGNASDNSFDLTASTVGVSVDGAEGNDSIHGSHHNDVLIGGDGNDVIYGGLNQLVELVDQDGSVYVETLDSDILVGGAGADKLYGGAGADQLFIDYDDLAAGEVDGGKDYDIAIVDDDRAVTIEASSLGLEAVVGGGGNDVISVYSIADNVIIDPLTGETFYIYNGNVVTGNYVSNVNYLLNQGSDGNYWYSTHETWNYFWDYSDSLEEVVGEDGQQQKADWLTTAPAVSTAINGELVEFAQWQSFQLAGGIGNDHITGAFGVDLLSGGAGDDWLLGEAGNDIYVYNLGDGHDTIYDVAKGVYNTVETHTLTRWVGVQSISPYSPEGNPIIDYTVSGHSAGEYYTNTLTVTGRYGGVDTLYFGEGIGFENLTFNGIWNAAANSYDLSVGISGYDENGQSVYGSILLSQFTNNDANIEFFTFTNGLTIDVSDLFSGFGDNNDNSLSGDEKSNVLQGFYGNDAIYGGGGNDFIVGGPGHDYLDGASGNDTYFFSQNDLIGYKSIVATEGDDYDILSFGHGIVLDDFSYTTGNSDITLWYGAGKAITLKDGFSGYVQFADGTVIDAAVLYGLAFASQSADTVTWTNTALMIDAGDGDDVIRTGVHDDIIFGGDGTDSIDAGAGNDVISAGGGGANWQLISGADGQDTYLYDRADKLVYVWEPDSAAAQDHIIFRDLNLSDFSIQYVDFGDGTYDVKFVWTDTDTNEAGALQLRNSGSHIDTFTFADGSSISDLSFKQYGGNWWLELTGTAENDYIVGSSYNDIISGGGGDDILQAGDAANGLHQVLYGNDGNDTYQILSSNGDISINYYAENANSGDADTIIFSDLNLDDLTFKYVASGQNTHTTNMLIEWDTGSLSIANSGQFIEKFVFADGNSFSSYQIISNSADIWEELTGSDDADYVAGSQAHSSHVYAGNGDDILAAGGSSGSAQMLFGQNGNDTYVIASANGDVVIDEVAESEISGTFDHVVFDDLTLHDIEVSLVNSTAAIGGASQAVLLFEWDNGSLEVADSGQHVERFSFADGTTISAVESLIIDEQSLLSFVGTDWADYILGTAASDVIYGGNGDDILSAGPTQNDEVQYLFGEDGNDEYWYSTQDGMVIIGPDAENADSGDADRLIFSDLEMWQIQATVLGPDTSYDGWLSIEWSDGSDFGTVLIAHGGAYIEEIEFSDGNITDIEDLLI